MRHRLNLFRGRVQVYLDSRHLWVGAYVSEDYVLICLLPMLVIQVAREPVSYWPAVSAWMRDADG